MFGRSAEVLVDSALSLKLTRALLGALDPPHRSNAARLEENHGEHVQYRIDLCLDYWCLCVYLFASVHIYLSICLSLHLSLSLYVYYNVLHRESSDYE